MREYQSKIEINRDNRQLNSTLQNNFGTIPIIKISGKGQKLKVGSKAVDVIISQKIQSKKVKKVKDIGDVDFLKENSNFEYSPMTSTAFPNESSSRQAMLD